MNKEHRASSFDELTKGLARGTVSRRKALKLMGAALFGGALASFPGAAWAAKGGGGGGGKSSCAKYCKSLFPGDTAAQETCTSQGTRGTGPCFACGGPGNPAPTCGTNETLNTSTCQCEAVVCVEGTTTGCGTCVSNEPGAGNRSCICQNLPGGTGQICYYGSVCCFDSCAACADYPGSVCVELTNAPPGTPPFACLYPCVNGAPCGGGF
jgi:hypothetical protein